MSRSTRSGTIFSPYEINFADLPAPEIIHTGVDLSVFLQAAMAAAELRATAFENYQDIPEADGDPDWEDDDETVDSRCSSPLSDLTASEPPTRAASPMTTPPDSPYVLLHTLTLSRG
jgi:hypothetical protein